MQTVKLVGKGPIQAKVQYEVECVSGMAIVVCYHFFTCMASVYTVDCV